MSIRKRATIQAIMSVFVIMLAISEVCIGNTSGITEIDGEITFGGGSQEAESSSKFRCQEFDVCVGREFGLWNCKLDFGWENADASRERGEWRGRVTVSGTMGESKTIDFKVMRGKSFPSSKDLLGLVDGSRYHSDTWGLAFQAKVGGMSSQVVRAEKVDNIGDDGCLTLIEVSAAPDTKWSFLADAVILSPRPKKHVLTSGESYITHTAQRILSLQTDYAVGSSVLIGTQLAVANSEKLTREVHVQQKSIAGCLWLGTKGRTWSETGGGFVQFALGSPGFRSYVGDKIVDENGGMNWEIGGYRWITPKLGIKAGFSGLTCETNANPFLPAAGEWEIRYLGDKNKYQLCGELDECMLLVTLPQQGFKGKSVRMGAQYRWSDKYARVYMADCSIWGSGLALDCRRDPKAVRVALDISREKVHTDVVWRKNEMLQVDQVYIKLSRDTEFGSISIHYGYDNGDLDVGWNHAPQIGISCQLRI